MQTEDSEERYHKVLYGPQCYQYYLSVALKPFRSLVLYEENRRQVRRVDLKDIVTIQRRISVASGSAKESSSAQKDIIEIHLSADGSVTLQFWLPSTQECEELCREIQTKLGVPVYSYGSLNLNFRSALGESQVARSSEDRTRYISKNYELIRDKFQLKSVDDVLSNLGIANEDFEHKRAEPPAQHSIKYPVIIEGTMEESSYISFRSVKTPHMLLASVYKVEWFLSKNRGSGDEYQETPLCMGDTFYLKDFMVGHYVRLKVYKAVGTDINRSFIFCTATRGPIRLSSALAHSVLLNISKNNEVHVVLVREIDLNNIAVQLNKVPQNMNVVHRNQISGSENGTDSLLERHDLLNPAKMTGEPETKQVTWKIKGPEDPTNDSLASESTGSFNSDDDDRLSSVSDVEHQIQDCNENRSSEKVPMNDKADDRLREEEKHMALSAELETKAGGDNSTVNAVKSNLGPQNQVQAGRPPKTQATPEAKPGGGQKPGLSPKPVNASAPNKFKNFLGRLFKKDAKPNAPAATKQSATARNKPVTKEAASAKLKQKAIDAPQPDVHYIPIRLQNTCKGIKLWTDKTELDIPWNRIELFVNDGNRLDRYQSGVPAMENLLSLKYKRETATGEVILPLQLKTASTNQHNTLFHSMVFNKYRRHFYTIDQGERDLQRGYYTDVKDSYARIWKYIAHLRAAV